jgi:transcription elongation factor Elf1
VKFDDPEYTYGAPSEEIAKNDARIAEKIPCPYCGTRCYYEAWHREGSYIALAVCDSCGWYVEF